MSARSGKGKAKTGRDTPVMQQFLRCKAEVPHAILFFRLGDFYEMFYEDAPLAAEVLGLTLTSRNKSSDDPIPMAGIPHHAAAGYIARLLSAGHSVAVCEQMADPSTVKGVVPREIVRVITPGLCLEPDALEDRKSHNLVTFCAPSDSTPADGQPCEPGSWGVAVLDASVSDLRVSTHQGQAAVVAELMRSEPREILLPTPTEGGAPPIEPGALRALFPNTTLTHLDQVLSHPRRSDLRQSHPPQSCPPRVGGPEQELPKEVSQLPAASRIAASQVLAYARHLNPQGPLPFQRISQGESQSTLQLDGASVRNLELVSTLDGKQEGSLLHHMDRTRTALGARLLRRRVLSPPLERSWLQQRYDHVQRWVDAPVTRDNVQTRLKSVADIERLVTRAEHGTATPRDLHQIRTSLQSCIAIEACIATDTSIGTDASVAWECTRAALPSSLLELSQRLDRTLAEDPAPTPAQGAIIAQGADAELDDLRQTASGSKNQLLELEKRERTQTGIDTLKIKYTRVFGYYIEVTRTHLSKVPEHYRRKQTVAGAERYIIDELDTLQEKILTADDRAQARETELVEQLLGHVVNRANDLRRWAQGLAELDLDVAMASLASERGYVRPELHGGVGVQFKRLRHPVIEAHLRHGTFVPNDLCLDGDAHRFMLITGPNMAGKSTVMRQVALAVVMAHVGAFVPAASARLGHVDRIFTRVGASDNLREGKSTFMVEMTETAAILRHATAHSLVLLDEIGRGTGTLDGLSIAWAVTRHIHDRIQCPTMFATHFHELCELSHTLGGLENYRVATRLDTADDSQARMVFLHHLEPGASSHSYGLEVARLAGLPEAVLQSAANRLGQLEQASTGSGSQQLLPLGGATAKECPAPTREVLPPTVRDLLAELSTLDPNQLTPLQALTRLAEFSQRAAIESLGPVKRPQT